MYVVNTQTNVVEDAHSLTIGSAALAVHPNGKLAYVGDHSSPNTFGPTGTHRTAFLTSITESATYGTDAWHSSGFGFMILLPTSLS